MGVRSNTPTDLRSDSPQGENFLSQVDIVTIKIYSNPKYFILQKSVKNPSKKLNDVEFENADIVFSMRGFRNSAER